MVYGKMKNIFMQNRIITGLVMGVLLSTSLIRQFAPFVVNDSALYMSIITVFSPIIGIATQKYLRRLISTRSKYLSHTERLQSIVVSLVFAALLLLALPDAIPVVQNHVGGLTQAVVYTGHFLVASIIILQVSTHLIRRQQVVPQGTLAMHRRILFYSLPMLVAWFATLLAFYPGIMSVDSQYSWLQISTQQYSDSFPVLYSWIGWCVTRVWHSPAAIATWQIIFLSLSVGYAMFSLERVGIRRKVLWMLALTFSAVPLYNMMAVSLWADIPYTACLLLMTVFVINIRYTDGLWLRSSVNVILVVIVAVLTILFRHNGLLPSIATLGWIIIASIRYWKRCTSMLTLVIALAWTIQGPVYKLANVAPTAAFLPLMGPLHGIASVVYAAKDIPDADRTVINTLAPEDVWKSRYNMYVLDPIAFDPKFNLNALNSPAVRKEVEQVWLDLARRYPAIILKDRLLDLSSLCWRITQPGDGYTYTTEVQVVNAPQYQSLGLKTESLSPWLMNLWLAVSNASKTPQLLWLFWRPALYTFAACLALVIFFIRRPRAMTLAPFVPTVANIAGLWVTIGAQDVRYFLVVFFTVPLLLILPGIRSTISQ